MRRLTFLAILVIAMAAPTFGSTRRYDDNTSPVRTFLKQLLKALDLERISLPPG